MNAITAHYDTAFFDQHWPWKADYEWLAGTLAQHLSHDTAIDLGCGCGFAIARLATLGRRVRMIDGSEAARAYDERIEVINLCEPPDTPLGKFELVICTEVAEHLSPAAGDVLLDTIAACAARWVFFSAARPGFGGHEHLNEQEPSYWLARFHKHGICHCVGLTEIVRAQLRIATPGAWWLATNGMVLTA